ncbi:MAG: hypothetical protein HYR91_11380 [Flavobacteriia bacterium]|nr:hypothetical protein [Flavobacteriia bacterium]
MKKSLFAFASAILLSNNLSAQCPIAEGQAQLNAGVGLSSWGIPVYVGLDYGVHKDITIGGELSYRRYNDYYYNKNYYTNYYRSIIGVSGNANYHFNSLLSIPTNWDFYAGLNIGFYLWSSSSYNNNGNHTSGIGIGGQIGGRYYFNEKIGVNLEFGGGNSFSGGKFGISLKF